MADQSELLSDNEKALLDTEELSGIDDEPVAPDTDKVELDLEDAPFLEDEEEEEEEAAATGEEEFSDLEAAPKKFDIKTLIRDRRFQIGSGAGLLILLVALFFLVWPSHEPIPDIPVELPEQTAATEQPLPPPPPLEEEPEEFIVSFEPFWVEHQEANGTVRFLYCKFAAPAPSEKLAWEIRHKKVVLRDAIFYYLRNKDLTFLADKSNAELLKKDLLSVINQYLGNAQLESILIEEYLVK
ncbi:flagellar basal body-associated FliL family protein [Oceanidesulfovibrio marinus]|uniref:Flagellar protein FliL n=1 Tax=Oceanidesulfovibrio marinus TaxID=370038 RepID=A0ABX6NJ80_9BACT|nr:flagellar basal body-associated FliL family protein [Oceanidesulfovibrio marinus]QJT09700.1 flagellar basal body-associated FliL family protein [Oceanidesulfovibrio marinus]